MTNDLKCLHHVMHKYNKTVFKDFLINPVGKSSYSALSKSAFVTKYYPKIAARIPVLHGYIDA